MSLANDLPGSNVPGDIPQDAAARLREQSQLDFDIDFFDAVLDRQPEYLDVLRCQAQLLSRKGLHVRALHLDRRLVQLDPEDAVAHYNLGCSLAVMGYSEDAVNAIRQALLRGYRDFEFLESDSDLDTLRDHPAFQDLLREFGAAE